MGQQHTLAIIKPCAVQMRHVGKIITAIEQGGFAIKNLRMATLTSELVREFYEEHLEKPFFPTLEAYMLEGSVVLMVLEREDAVAHWRALIGATNPAEAAPGTLRSLYGESVQRNALHGSDSPTSAEREIQFFFPVS